MVQNSRVRVYYRYALLLLGLEDSHGEFLRLLFLQAHRETAAHFTAIGMPAQQHCDFRRAAFYNGLKSKVGLAAAKTAAMRINLNIDGSPPSSRLVLAERQPVGPNEKRSFVTPFKV